MLGFLLGRTISVIFNRLILKEYPDVTQNLKLFPNHIFTFWLQTTGLWGIVQYYITVFVLIKHTAYREWNTLSYLLDQSASCLYHNETVMIVNVIILLSFNSQNRIHEEVPEGTLWAAKYSPLFLPTQVFQVMTMPSLFWKGGIQFPFLLFQLEDHSIWKHLQSCCKTVNLFLNENCSQTTPCHCKTLLHYNSYLIKWESFILQELAVGVTPKPFVFSSAKDSIPSSC